MDYGLAFLTGLFGSMHCVGMCGAIVVGYSTQQAFVERRTFVKLASHLVYNGGRVLSYTLLGGLFGLVGRGLSVLQGMGYWFSLLMGGILVLWGVSLLKVVPGFSSRAELQLGQESSNLLFQLYRRSFPTLIRHQGLESKFYTGFLTPLLPCGLLYSMLVRAAGSSDLLEGAAVMLCFGLGIVPALTVTGLLGSYFGTRLRSWGDKLSAVTVLLMGLMMIVRALGLPFVSIHHH